MKRFKIEARRLCLATGEKDMFRQENAVLRDNLEEANKLLFTYKSDKDVDVNDIKDNDSPRWKVYAEVNVTSSQSPYCTIDNANVDHVNADDADNDDESSDEENVYDEDNVTSSQ